MSNVYKFDIDNDKLDYKFNYNSEETNKLRELSQNDENINENLLFRIAQWKLNRIIYIPESLIEQLKKLKNQTSVSIDDEDIKKLILDLVECDGVGYPMASTILKFIRPDIFPIIDVRAYRALFGKKITYSQYSIKKYLEYCEKIYEIKDKKKMELFQIDELLYEFDKEKNMKI